MNESKQQLKQKIKCPTVIKIIILSYCTSPILHLLAIKTMDAATKANLYQSMGDYHLYISTPLILSMPIIGLFLFAFNRFSWYLFMTHASLLLFDNIYRIIKYPENYAYMILFASLFLIAITFILLLKQYRSSYFQVISRSNRESKRIPIHHHILANDRNFLTTDLSSGGCFIKTPQDTFILGQKVSIDFSSESLVIHCLGRVVRITHNGVGVRFLTLSPIEKLDIKNLIKNRFTLRYHIEMFADLQLNDDTITSEVYNISQSGMYLITDQIKNLEKGQLVEVTFNIGDRKYQLQSKIKWINKKIEYNKPLGVGIEFTKTIARLESHLKKAKLLDRQLR